MDKIYDVKAFFECLDTATDAGEFSLNCVLHGIAAYATKAYFDNVIFPFVMSNVCTRHDLKYKLRLKNNLLKLHNIYLELPDI